MKNFIKIVTLCILSLFILTPFIVMIISSFSTSEAIKGNDIFSNISLNNLVNNIKVLFSDRKFVSSLFNSFIVSILAAAIGVLISSMAGYAYFVNKSKLVDFLFISTIISMLIPLSTVVIPIFILFNYIKLLDTYASLILTSLSVPFLVYLFKQNMSLLPRNLLKAARLDGISDLKIYAKIYVPCMKPVFYAAFLISFYDSWNAILLPVVLIQSQKKFTNALYLSSLGSIWYADYSILMLALFISILPTLIMLVVFQRPLRNSILAGTN